MIKDPERHDPTFKVTFEDANGKKRSQEVQTLDEFKAYDWAHVNRQGGEKVAEITQVTNPCRLYNIDRQMYVKRNRYFDLWFDTPDEAIRFVNLYDLDPLIFVVA